MPVIPADDGDLARVAAEAWAALLKANDPPKIFRHGGVMAWIERDDTGEPITRHLTSDRLRYQLARVARWERTAKGQTRAANPPGAVVGDLLATPDPPLPILERIVECPVFAPSGTVSLEPGYHPEARVYYQPGQLDVPTIPLHPTTEDLARARKLLLEDMFGDFPFVDEAARAHTIALALQPACRGLIDGPTPLYVIEKPSPGTGASLLVNQIGVLTTGRPPAALTEGSSEDEWRKRITSKLMRSPSLIVIDNLRERLDSAALSAALTADTFEDRVLGLSQMVTLPVRCTWVATGNNPAMSNEIARRSISIRLDAKVDRPWERGPDAFRHASLGACARTVASLSGQRSPSRAPGSQKVGPIR
jgi:putative DNA primase/helicase